MGRKAKREPTPLSRFFDQHLKRNHLTNEAFAKKIGKAPQSFNDLKYRTGPDHRVEDEATIWQWAELLHLSADERQLLFELVQLAYSPPYVREMVDDLRQSRPVRRVAHPKDRYRPRDRQPGS